MVNVSDFIKEKAKALADYLGIDKKDLRYNSIGETDYFVTPDGDEFIVCSDEEATKLAKEQIQNIIDDIGINSFSPDFVQTIMDREYVDKDWFEDAQKESNEYYANDIEGETYQTTYANRLIDEMVDAGILSEDDLTEDGEVKDDIDMDEKKEEFVDYLNNQYDDPVEWYRDNFGDIEFNQTVTGQGLLDYDAVADEVIEWDGRGPTLSSYDGEERELDNGFFAYKYDEGADNDYRTWDEIDFSEETTESLKEGKKQLNEGPGAGYTIEAEVVLDKINSLKLTKVTDLKEGYYGGFVVYADFDCDIDASAHDVKFNSSYYGNSLEGPEAVKVTKISMNFGIDPFGSVDDKEEYSKKMATVTVDNVSQYIDTSDLAYNVEGSRVTTKYVYGGGYVHSTYDGTISTLEEGVINSDNYIEEVGAMEAKLTDENTVQYIDKVVLGDTQFSTYELADKDGDLLYGVSFDNFDDAVEYAKEHEEVAEIIRFDWEEYVDGSTDYIDTETVWERDDYMDESLKEAVSSEYDDLFQGMLELMEFTVVKSKHPDDGKYALYDMQGANLGGIEDDSFDSAMQMVDRMDAYIDDYFLRPIEEIAEESKIEIPDDVSTVEDFVKWYNQHKDEKEFKEAFSQSDWDFKVLDMIANHIDEVDLDKVYDKYYKDDDIDESLNEGILDKIKQIINGGKANKQKAFDDISDILLDDTYSAKPDRNVNRIRVDEDTVKLKNGKYANVGDDGKVDSGTFNTKKEADAQRKAMFANKK